MYRTAPAQPSLERVNVDAAHARSATRFAVVYGALFVAYLFARMYASEPPPEIADRVALALPLVVALPLAYASAIAARVSLPAKRLPHTATSPTAVGVLLCFFTVGVLLFVLLLWIMAPHTWSESWSCHSNGRGKTSCNIAANVSGWATVVFVVGILPAFAAGLAGIVAIVEAVQSLRRSSGGLQLHIDADVAAPEPERPVTIDLVVGGDARLDKVEVRLERTASFRQGKRTTVKVQGAFVLLQSGDVATTKATPALVRGNGIAPPRPNAADLGAESVAQRYVVEYVVDGVTGSETFDLPEPEAAPPIAG